jgi:hypothetical protein
VNDINRKYEKALDDYAIGQSELAFEFLFNGIYEIVKDGIGKNVGKVATEQEVVRALNEISKVSVILKDEVYTNFNLYK